MRPANGDRAVDSGDGEASLQLARGAVTISVTLRSKNLRATAVVITARVDRDQRRSGNSSLCCTVVYSTPGENYSL